MAMVGAPCETKSAVMTLSSHARCESDSSRAFARGLDHAQQLPNTIATGNSADEGLEKMQNREREFIIVLQVLGERLQRPMTSRVVRAVRIEGANGHWIGASSISRCLDFDIRLAVVRSAALFIWPEARVARKNEEVVAGVDRNRHQPVVQ